MREMTPYEAMVWAAAFVTALGDGDDASGSADHAHRVVLDLRDASADHDAEAAAMLRQMRGEG